MDATWCLKDRLVQLFGVIAQTHDATTSIGKLKANHKGCWIFSAIMNSWIV